MFLICYNGDGFVFIFQLICVFLLLDYFNLFVDELVN